MRSVLIGIAMLLSTVVYAGVRSSDCLAGIHPDIPSDAPQPANEMSDLAMAVRYPETASQDGIEGTVLLLGSS